MLTRDRTTQQSRAPVQGNGTRWWLVTGLVGLATIGLGGFWATALGFDLTGTWLEVIVQWGPLALAGVITGIVGGVRRWWLLVPTALAPLMWWGAVVSEGVLYPAISGFGYWTLLVGTTAVVTVVAVWLIRRFAS